MPRFLSTLPALAALLLAACTTIPVSSLAPLSRIDAATTDLARLRVALRMPPAVRPNPDGVKLDVTVREDGGPARTVSFDLAEQNDAAEIASVPDDSGSALPVHLFALTAESVSAFTALRTEAMARHAAGHHVSLGLGVAAREFCKTTDAAINSLPVTTYLKTSETGIFITASRDYDFATDPKTATAIRTIRTCPDAAL